MQGGVYIFQILDYYSASGMSMLFLVFFQTISISWIFGGRRFCDCIEQMIGHQPSKFLYVCWVYFAPAVMAVSSLIPLAIHLSVSLTSQQLIGDDCWTFAGHFLILHRSLRGGDVRKWLQVSSVGGILRNLPVSCVYVVDSAVRHVLRHFYTGHFARGSQARSDARLQTSIQTGRRGEKRNCPLKFQFQLNFNWISIAPLRRNVAIYHKKRGFHHFYSNYSFISLVQLLNSLLFDTTWFNI